jgi:hypothetical protein
LAWMEMKILDKTSPWKDRNSTITKLTNKNYSQLDWMVTKISDKTSLWKDKNSTTTKNSENRRRKFFENGRCELILLSIIIIIKIPYLRKITSFI